MSTFDLKLCRKCSDEQFAKKFGKVPDFYKLEAMFAGARGREKALKHHLLKKMSSPKYWNLSEFWLIPSWSQFRRHAKETRGLFRDLCSNEREVISTLYRIFKNIEVASIILRFVDPVDYGIISPPVRAALRQKARDNYVDEYLDYLHLLRGLAREHGFDRVAEADIALWTLVEKCLRDDTAGCDNFRGYQEKLIIVEEEYIRKSQLFRKTEDDISGLAELADEELGQKRAELEALRREVQRLLKEKATFPEQLIKLDKSNREAEEKVIHDRRELELDGGQKHFMYKLAGYEYVNQIVWSENISTKHPTRISAIQDNGELTVLYVSKDNYAAKIKVRPVRCPDLTHARYFASLIAGHMGIPIKEDIKKGARDA